MFRLFEWGTRRCGGLAMIATLCLSYWVLIGEPALRALKPPPITDGAGFWTTLFALNCLAAHFLIATFYIRLNYATLNVTSRLAALKKKNEAEKSVDTLPRHGVPNHGAYLTSSDLIHAIIIPNYKEDIEILHETLDVLASHDGAKGHYDICLAMEQREKEAFSKAKTLIDAYSSSFRSVFYTTHPPDIPGESPGKGSNLAWAVQQVSDRYPLTIRKNIIVTGIDADSHLSRQYFALLDELHLSHPETALTTLYAAPIIFDRNPYEVPALTRVADILWGATGISGLYSGSTIAPPTSVYSLPLVLIDRVGGWDCDCEAIGEDLHMFIKCFFALNGNLNVQTILSPVSQTNVNGDGSFLSDVAARYKQGLRHMWGALDCGYYIRLCVNLFRERNQSLRAFHPLHLQIHFSDHISGSPTNTADYEVESGIFRDVTSVTLDAPNWGRVLLLGHRLLELHFMPVQVTIAVTLNVFLWANKGNLPHDLNWIFQGCSILGAISGMQLPFYLFIYARYHAIAVDSREKEMIKAGLADGMRFAHRDWRSVVDYFVGPVVLLLSGVFPAFHAQISHFWKLDLTYTVSKKVTRQGSEKKP
ncbi:hypothetical protein NW759_014887 [Fusarium solani]|nr:hypothetical protein NW759_014887 [Fusarium solani]